MSKKPVPKTTTERLAAYLKQNKFMTGVIVVGIVAIVGIAGVMAATNNNNDQDSKKPTTSQADDSKKDAGKDVATAPATSTTTDKTNAVLGESTSTTKIQSQAPSTQTAAVVVPASVATNPQTDAPVVTPANPQDPTTPTTPTDPVVTPPVDPTPTNAAPTITLGAPINGATVSGVVALNATATDDKAGYTIQYSVDGANLQSANWDTKTVADGSHVVTATVTDSDGVKATASATVTVSNPVVVTPPVNAAPTISLAAPTANATVSGTVALTANAADDKTGFTVQFSIDGVNVQGSLATAPYSINWDTKTATNGVHTLTATVTDSDGVATSTSATVTVNNTVVTPPALTGFTGGRVSLTFDDDVSSIYTNGLPLLHQYGFKSTQYLISETLKNNAEYPGYYNQAQAKEFYSADKGVVGTELAAHTMYHCSLTVATTTDDAAHCLVNLTAAQQATQNQRELVQGKADLKAMFPNFNFNNIASPYGAYDDTSIAEIKADGYASHRSTDEGFNSYGTLDSYNILVQNVEKATTVAQVKAWVDQAKATNTWLVLVYHDVAGDGEVVGDYGVSKADLQAQFEYIKTTGINVVTVAEALAENAQATQQ